MDVKTIPTHHAFMRILKIACAALLFTACSVVKPTKPVPAKTSPPIPSVIQQALTAAQPITPIARILAAAGPTVTLAWSPGVPNNPPANGYKVYQGGAAQTYTNIVDVGNTTNVQFLNLVSNGTYFFAATSYYNSNGVQSPFSNEVKYTVPAQKKTVLIINTFVETSTNDQWSGWTIVTNAPTLYVTNPPSPVFFRSRMTIDTTNSP